MKQLILSFLLISNVSLYCSDKQERSKSFKGNHPVLYRTMKYSGIIVTSVIATLAVISLSNKRKSTEQKSKTDRIVYTQNDFYADVAYSAGASRR